VGRQDSQNTPEYDGVSQHQDDGFAVGRPDQAPSVPIAPRPTGHTYGRASVPVNDAQRPQPSPPPQPPAGPADEPGGPVRGVAEPQSGGAPAAEPATRRSRRTFLLSGLSVLVLAVLLAVTLVVRPGPVDGWLSSAPTTPPPSIPAPDPTPTPVLLAAPTDGTAPTAEGVKAAIGPLVTAPALGPQVNVSVVDAATGTSLYERNADTMTTPASTTKVLTAATVLAARGPAYRLTTRAVAGNAPGEVVLVGGGDPTLSVDADGQFPGAARLDKLAAQVKKALGGAEPAKVVIDTSLYAGKETAVGWDGDVIGGGQVARIQALMTNAGRIEPVHHEFGGDPRFSDPALAAGKAFARRLGVPTGTVTRGKAPAAPAPAASAAPTTTVVPGAELGKVQSPPLVHVIDWMLQQSDNVIAEAMGRQVALAAGGEASFDGAAKAMVAKLAELGLPADEANLYDASGLSRHNGISPKLLTDVLTLAAGGKHPELSSLFGGLPVAGWSGTLRTRFATPAPNRVGQGLVRAKTGSLTGVNTISGQVVTRDGRLLVFAIMADATGASGAARQALDKIAAKLVTCGCQ
jgi:serine-type D-Ala-D-Ala carboxypeptidase/endopeptidase (penicillin-binding protein 4)